MNKRHYEHTLPNIRGSLSNTYFPFYKGHFSVFILCHFRLSSPFFLDDEIFFAKLYLFSETCGL